MGKYSFVKRTIKNWNQLTEEALRTFPCKVQFVEKGLGKQLLRRWSERNRSVAKIVWK